jgi:hypothetical protein
MRIMFKEVFLPDSSGVEMFQALFREGQGAGKFRGDL